METLTDILGKIKIAHWRSKNYNTHKILDKLYGKLDNNFDELAEVLLANRQDKSKEEQPAVDDYLQKTLEKFKEIHRNTTIPSVSAILEDIMVELERALYLLKMK